MIDDADIDTDVARVPLTTVDEWKALDERDVLHGYLAGLAGREEPGVEFNRDYWHGWRNGMIDSKRMRPDAASAALAHAAVSSGALREWVAAATQENAEAK